MSYYVIRRTCPTIRTSTYYGVSWPAGRLMQDPLNLKPLYEPQQQPLTQSMVLLFPKREMADMFTRMILVHYGMTGEMPTRVIHPDLQHDSWAWSLESMLSIKDSDLQREGFDIEEIQLSRVTDIALRTGVLFAEIEFDDYTAIRPPQRYGVQQVMLPLVSQQTALWKKNLHRSWILESDPHHPDI